MLKTIKSNKIKELKRNIHVKYITALGIIGLLSTLAFITINMVIKEHEHTNYIVNISGKQRMLSQHIALDVYRIYDHILNNNLSFENSLYAHRTTLKNNINEFLNANKILTSGKLINGAKLELSPEIQTMYFGDLNISQRVISYAKLARTIFETTSIEELDTIKNKLDETSEQLLIDLNKVVHQYEIEGNNKLEQLNLYEQIVWIVTLFALLLEVIFIFLPMTKQIIKLSKTQQINKEELEKAVELQTLHLEVVNKKLQFAASHDPLTGLKNRFELEKYQDAAIEGYEKNHSPYAVLMLDIDYFKKVNDTYGHDVGDDVLKKVSAIMESSVRESDKVFRAGGEEFVIILNRIEFEDSKTIAEKIRLVIENSIFTAVNETFSITISSGLFHSDLYQPKNHRDIAKLIDIALYESKSNGRNRLTVVNENIITALQTKKNKES